MDERSLLKLKAEKERANIEGCREVGTFLQREKGSEKVQIIIVKAFTSITETCSCQRRHFVSGNPRVQIPEHPYTSLVEVEAVLALGPALRLGFNSPASGPVQ